MPAIHIRDIPEDVLVALKKRAARNSRSLQMEIRHSLIMMARETPEVAPFPPIELRMSTQANGESSWSRDEIYEDS